MDEDEKCKALIKAKWIHKDFICKMLIFGTIAFTVIILFSIAGIVVASNYKQKEIAQYVENEVEQEEIIEEEPIEQEEKKNPVYSEQAQNEINNIYKSEEGDETKIAYLTFDDRTFSKYYSADFTNTRRRRNKSNIFCTWIKS